MDRILARMLEAHARSGVDNFLAHVAEYGANSGVGYEHGSKISDSSYATPFLTSFFRAYDMSDSAIGVLRRADVVIRHHVDVNSVRFRVELPTTAGPGNPIAGANQAAQLILGIDA